MWGKGPTPRVGRAPSPGGPGPKPPGDLAHRPLGPGSRHYNGLTSSQVFNFLLRLKSMGPGLKTLGCYHNPQSADLGGRWMVSEGFHERRFPSSLQHFLHPGSLAASRIPKMPRCSSAHEKPGLVAPIDFLRTVLAA